jgi:hypothetical protein
MFEEMNTGSFAPFCFKASICLSSTTCVDRRKTPFWHQIASSVFDKNLLCKYKLLCRFNPEILKQRPQFYDYEEADHIKRGSPADSAFESSNLNFIEVFGYKLPGQKLSHNFFNVLNRLIGVKVYAYCTSLRHEMNKKQLEFAVYFLPLI